MAMDNLDFSALKRAVVKRVHDMPELLDNEIDQNNILYTSVLLHAQLEDRRLKLVRDQLKTTEKYSHYSLD